MPAVIAIPGIAVELSLAAFAWVIVFFLLSVIVVVGGFLQSIADAIPFLGGYLADGIGYVTSLVITFLQSWLDGTEIILHDLWSGISAAIDYWVSTMFAFGGDVYNGLFALRHAVIPHLIDAITFPINEAVDAVRGLIAEAIDPIWNYVHNLDALLASWVKFLGDGIDALGSRVDSLSDTLYHRGIDAIDHILDDIIPSLRDAINGVRTRVDALYDRLTGIDFADLKAALPWLVSITAAFTASEAITAIRSAKEFKPKADKLCNLSLDEVDDLMGLLLPALNIEVIREIARVSAEVTSDVAPAINEMLTIGD